MLHKLHPVCVIDIWTSGGKKNCTIISYAHWKPQHGSAAQSHNNNLLFPHMTCPVHLFLTNSDSAFLHCNPKAPFLLSHCCRCELMMTSRDPVYNHEEYTLPLLLHFYCRVMFNSIRVSESLLWYRESARKLKVTDYKTCKECTCLPSVTLQVQI